MANETPGRKRKQPLRPRHVPQRTCIVCRQVRPKRELIRVVRTPEARIELDAGGKKSGRGAYLCARRSCWEPALHKGKLEHEFEVTLQPEDRAALEAYLDSLPPEPMESTAGKAKAPRGKAAKQSAESTPATQPQSHAKNPASSS
ncbi:MAG TPA: YlxR family protein [Ktedonobacterales bacterium]|jgi:hypothetical protein|nr:YlxR family protein [Ktedonobacterales bacterium]